MKLLLTGATGFIGTHVLRLLQELQVEVHCVSRHQMSDSNEAMWHELDLFDLYATTKLIDRIKATHLLHFAWETTPGVYWTSQANFQWVQASLHLLMAFHMAGGQRVVFTGTCAEYDWKYGYLTEDITPLNPQSPYGICKASMYNLFASYTQQTGLSAAWGRQFFLYGIGEKLDRLVPYVIQTLLQNKIVETTSGDQLRDFLYVKDVAAAFVALLLSQIEGAVNIASGDPVRLRDVVLSIAEIIGKPDLINLGAREDGNQAVAIIGNPMRLQKEVGWKQRYLLPQGLEETIHWLQDRKLKQ